MPKYNIIKLANVNTEFDRNTGVEKNIIVADEYVCENCRHLVGKSDKFCWQCGEELSESNIVEHYRKGKKISNSEYSRLK
jgi:predicted amidophosphoribosyltransferase